MDGLTQQSGQLNKKFRWPNTPFVPIRANLVNGDVVSLEDKKKLNLGVLEKKHVKFLYVYKDSWRDSKSYFGIVTDDFSLYQYLTLINLKNKMTTQAMKAIREIFLPFKLDERTKVCISELVRTNIDPLYILMNLLFSIIDFNSYKTLTADAMLNRIIYYHKYFRNRTVKRVKKGYTQKLWNKLLETEACPWINTEIDLQYKMTSLKTYKVQLNIRLGLYYMVISNYLLEIKNRCNQRKALKVHET